MNGIIKYLVFLTLLLACENEEPNRNRKAVNWYFENKSGERITLKLYLGGNVLRSTYSIKNGKSCYFASSTIDGYDINTPPGIGKLVLESSDGTVISDSCDYILGPLLQYLPIDNCNQKPNSFFNINSYERRDRKVLFSKRRIFDLYFVYTGK
jgi:hypothetical protein